MRLNWGAIPKPEGVILGVDWTPLREPSPWMMQLMALPIGIASCFAIGWLWLHLTPLPHEQLMADPAVCAGLFLVIPLIAIHELIHAFFHPHFGKSKLSVIGFWPSKMLFYAHYEGELTRNRFLTILAMPLIVISICPLLVLAVSEHTNAYMAWVSIWNAFLACGDVFGILLLSFQVPSDGVCRNLSWNTYWKLNGR